MIFRHLNLITASLLLATSYAAAQVPDNASATEYYSVDGWECNSGYRKVGNNCVARCKKKPSTCLRTFIKKNDYVSASNLYNENQELFLTAREKKRRAKQLQELAVYLNKSFAPQIDALQNSLSLLRFDALDSSGWTDVDSLLSAARGLLANYFAHNILKDDEYTLPSANTLAKSLNIEQERINGQLQSAFMKYDHAKGDGFFDFYPIEVAGGMARKINVRAAWSDFQPMIHVMNRAELLHLIDAWTSGKPKTFGSTFGADIRSSIADLYYDKLIRQYQKNGHSYPQHSMVKQ